MDFLGGNIFRNFGGGSFPSVHVYEKDANIVLEAEIGHELNKDDIVLRATDKTIIIEGYKPCPEEKGVNVLYSERFCGRFKKEIQLPCKIDTDDVEGEFNNGILTVTTKSVGKRSRESVGIRIKSNNYS